MPFVWRQLLVSAVVDEVLLVVDVAIELPVVDAIVVAGQPVVVATVPPDVPKQTKKYMDE